MSRSVLDLGMVTAALVVAGCAAASDDQGINRLQVAGITTGIPVASMLERRFQTVVRQQFDFSCGSAALATLLASHYGRATDERAAFLGMWRDGDRAQIRKLGFSLLDMKHWLAGIGLKSDGYQVTLDQIARSGAPGIALIDAGGYKHFVVVKGIDGTSVLIGDPALGLRRISRRAFGREWNGIYFVIDAPAGALKPEFGRASEFALAPGGRTTLEMLPVSPAYLALTRLNPGEL